MLQYKHMNNKSSPSLARIFLLFLAGVLAVCGFYMVFGGIMHYWLLTPDLIRAVFWWSGAAALLLFSWLVFKAAK